MRKIDVAIIGAGTAGLSARREVVKHTSNYLVIESGPVGTTCARVGCMPSKVFIEAANSYYKRFSMKKMGVSETEILSIDHEILMKHVRDLRNRFVNSVIHGMEDWEQTHLLKGKAKFISPNTLSVNEEKIEAKKIIIATGSTPVIPKDWFPVRDLLITTDEFFELRSLPKCMAVIGTGVIGLELGQALARVGVETIGIGKGTSLGGLTDPEILRYTTQKINEELPLFSTGVDTLERRNGKLLITSDQKTFEVDRALVAVGRRSNLSDLGLEDIGVNLGDKGIPELESGTFRIKGTDIYLVGDGNGERPILHEAADEGKIGGFNSVRDEDQKFQRRLSLSITFSSPNCAVVGSSFLDLRRDGIDFIAGKVSFEGQGRAIVKDEEKGMLKVYGDRKTGRLLGAELFAPGGEHLAHLLAWAIDCQMTVSEALQKPFYHPVLEEGVRTALRNLAIQIETEISELDLMRCEGPPVGG